MIKEKYSDLPFNNFDAAMYVIQSCLPEKDPQISFDIGDGQKAIFEIRMLEDEDFYFKESLDSPDGLVVDEDTLGEYPFDQTVELIIARLQILDDLTDYPRLPAPIKASIKKSLAVAGVVEKYDPDQPRDDRGRFGSNNEGDTSTGSGKVGKPIPTTDSQRNLKTDDSKLGAGKARNLSRTEVLQAYEAKVQAFNPGYTIASDGGAAFNHSWKSVGARPENYPKDMPFNPRTQNVKEGDWSKEYQPFASKEEIIGWMKEGDLGAHKASVMLHELYAHATQRQGNFEQYDYKKVDNTKGDAKDSVNRFLEKQKFAGFDVDIHHMIPASLGGSNKGPNLVALTPAEHTIAHVLEWSLAKDYSKTGEVIKQGKWGGSHKTFEESGANIKANNIYRALTLQTVAAQKSGNVKEYFKKANADPSRRQAMFATAKSLQLLKKMNLIDTDDVTKLKLDHTGRPKWTLGGKAATIKELEKRLLKGYKK